jgi:hypothetical protein
MKHLLTALALGAALTAGAQAPFPQSKPLAPKAQYAADSRAATARYEGDKRLCNDETTSTARLQCRRDAKAEYDAAVAAAKARLASATAPGPAAPVPLQAACDGCGKVAAVTVREEAGKAGPVGLIAGGVGGAYAGKKIEEKVRAHQVWTVTVQYPNGASSSFAFDQDPGFKVGDPVRNSGNSVVRR